jgi:hypothetical protein
MWRRNKGIPVCLSHRNNTAAVLNNHTCYSLISSRKWFSRFYTRWQQFMLAAAVLSRGQSGNYPAHHIQTFPQQFIFMHLWLTFPSWMKRSSDCTKTVLTSDVLTPKSKFEKAQIMDLIWTRMMWILFYLKLGTFPCKPKIFRKC